MSEIKVKSGREEGATVITVNYPMPESTAAFVEKFGEEVTCDLLTRATTLGIQAVVRTKMAAGTTDQASLQGTIDNWQPGVRGPVTRKSPLERATSALSELSPEALAELLAKVKAAQKAKG